MSEAKYLGLTANQLAKVASNLEAENAKLRELGGTMLRCIVSERNKPCWECPAHKDFDELRSFCCIRDDAAELGIEVKS